MIMLAIALATATPDPLARQWEGSSLCQVKPSPCHDEHVVYHVTNLGRSTYRFAAYKIIAGEEQFMGNLDFHLDASGRELAAFYRDRAGVDHPWLFTLRGTHISGRALTAPGGRVFRLIEVDKR
jgi:hypothetical protein